MASNGTSKSFSNLEDALKFNLDLQKQYPLDAACTDISERSGAVNIQVCRSGMVEGKAFQDNDLPGLDVVIRFVESTPNDNYYWERFNQSVLFRLFKTKVIDFNESILRECYAEYEDDYTGAAKLVSTLIEEVYDLDNSQELTYNTWSDGADGVAAEDESSADTPYHADVIRSKDDNGNRLRIPEKIEIGNLFGTKSFEKTDWIPYVGYEGFPIYDANSVESYLTYVFDIGKTSGGEIPYDTVFTFDLGLEITDNTDKLNIEPGVSLLGDIDSISFDLDGKQLVIDKPFKLKGKESKTALYMFHITKGELDAIVASQNISVRVNGTSSYFEADLLEEGFHLYSLLFSKLGEKWRTLLSLSPEPCCSILPDSCYINSELSGDEDLVKYEEFARRHNRAIVPKEKKNAQPSVRHKKKTGKSIKEAETLRKAYSKSLTSYSLTRYEAVYKSGLVIAEIDANKVTDVGFYNNPNLESQFTPDVGGRGGSGIMGALQEAAAESYAEKKRDEAIEKASKESAAKMVIYGVPSDPDNFKIDIVFFNRSKNREMNSPALLIDPTYPYSEIKGITHKNQSGNKFEDVMTVSIPFDYLFSINGKSATLMFDSEENEGNDSVIAEFRIKYDLSDLITVDYLVRGEYWSHSKRECYEPLLIKKNDLFLRSEKIDESNKRDEDIENKHSGIGCLAAIAITAIVGGLLSQIIESEAWDIILGVIVGSVAFYLIHKKGKEKTKASRDDTASKSARLKTDIANLKKEFESVYSSSDKK